MANEPEPELPSKPHAASGSVLLLSVLLVWMVIATLSTISYHTPPVAAPGSGSFSGSSALLRLKQILAEEQPHVAGSPAGARVAQRIATMLQSLGYELELQTGSGQVVSAVRNRSPDRQSVPLINLIARRSDPDGRFAEHRKLLIVAHHDSVPFGPGASDNGVGVASLLEIAAMIGDRDWRRDIVFLFTDGEELGLLGAKLFMDSHPLASQIGIVINLDARGTTGPSLMFETGPQSAQLVPAFGRSARRPFASSLFYEIYKRLPRDTDFSVFKRAGLDGFNFAFIGNVHNYHTPADNLQQVDPGSLQHHGENVLGLIEELQSSEFDPWFDPVSETSPIRQPNRARLVYFDLFGRRLVWWPESWSLWMAMLALAAWTATVIVGPATGMQIAKSGLMLTGCLAATGLVVWALFAWLPFHNRLANPWPENPTWLIVGMWFVGLAIVATTTQWDRESGMDQTGFLAVSGLWILLAIATSIWVTGASYLFVIPAVCSSLLGLLGTLPVSRQALPRTLSRWSIGATAIIIGVMWIPLERLFYDAVGLKMAEAATLRIALTTAALLPVFLTCTLRIRWIAALTAAVLAVSMISGSILLAK